MTTQCKHAASGCNYPEGECLVVCMGVQHTPMALGDLRGQSEAKIKQHIADNYAGKESGFDYGSPSDDDKAFLLKELENFDVLIAYESVGSWGCDSSSWFLLRNKQTGALYENHASHCSCYGFEGQWEPEVTTFQHIASDKFFFPAGGYDDASEINTETVKAYVRAAIAKDASQEGTQ